VNQSDISVASRDKIRFIITKFVDNDIEVFKKFLKIKNYDMFSPVYLEVGFSKDILSMILMYDSKDNVYYIKLEKFIEELNVVEYQDGILNTLIKRREMRLLDFCMELWGISIYKKIELYPKKLAKRKRIYQSFIRDFDNFIKLKKIQTQLYNIDEFIDDIKRMAKKEDTIKLYKYISIFYPDDFIKYQNKIFKNILDKLTEDEIYIEIEFIKKLINHDNSQKIDFELLLDKFSLGFISKLLNGLFVFNKISLNQYNNIHKKIYNKLSKELKSIGVFTRTMVYEAYLNEDDISKILSYSIADTNMELTQKIIQISKKLNFNIADILLDSLEMVFKKSRYIDKLILFFQNISGQNIDIFAISDEYIELNHLDKDCIAILLYFGKNIDKYIDILEKLLLKSNVKTPGIYRFKYSFEYQKMLNRGLLYKKVKLNTKYDSMEFYKNILLYIKKEVANSVT
jgi:hypothetical protein